MATSETNQAAWLVGEKVHPLEVGPGPDQSTVEADEVIVKVACVAINPVEWKLQGYDFLKLEYPFILGSDVAGEVVKIGTAVTNLKPGDRVISHCLNLGLQNSKYGAFQLYTTCREILVAKIPDAMPFTDAVVMPLAISTAATGLFEELKLDLPSLSPKAKDKAVVIWGGSSSCGGTAIQLASAAGYSVVTTASAHNHGYVKSLGATHVFDQSKSNVVAQINDVVKNKLAGVFDCIATKSTQSACAEIIKDNGGGILSLVLPPELEAEGVEFVPVWATNPGTTNKGLGEAIWGTYVPKALATGRLQTKPEPYIIEGGLQKIQEAMDVQKKGVSAKKVVVKL